MVLETHVFEIWDVSVKEIFKWTHLFFIQFLSKFKATQFSLLFFWIYFFNLFLLIFLFLFREICWYGFSFCFYSYPYEFSVKSNREARFWCTEKGQGIFCFCFEEYVDMDSLSVSIHIHMSLVWNQIVKHDFDVQRRVRVTGFDLGNKGLQLFVMTLFRARLIWLLSHCCLFVFNCIICTLHIIIIIIICL